MPERIQLKRTKGWRMPPNTVKVDRSTKWGNPYKSGPGHHMSARAAVGAYAEWLKRTWEGRDMATSARREIKGRNLACWCSLDEGVHCHADVLLEIANG